MKWIARILIIMVALAEVGALTYLVIALLKMWRGLGGASDGAEASQTLAAICWGS